MVIRSLSNIVTTNDILINYNHCILHFLDLENLNLTKQYLKLAWGQGSIGENHLYLINIEAGNKHPSLNFSEMFDFERMIIVSSSGVGMLDICMKSKTFLKMKHSQKTKHIISPNEFAKNDGFFTRILAWAPKTGK